MRETVTVGSGKATHYGNDCGTLCGAAHRNGFFTEPKAVKTAEVTCKRCLKIMATQVEIDHAEALTEEGDRQDAADLATADVQVGTVWVDAKDGSLAEVTRSEAFPAPRVSFRREDGSTGTLPLAGFAEAFSRLGGYEDLVAAGSRTVTTDRLVEGDLVLHCGMIVKLGAPTVRPGQGARALPVYSFPGAVVNMAEVRVPGHITAGLLKSDGQWPIQGNALAMWTRLAR